MTSYRELQATSGADDKHTHSDCSLIGAKKLDFGHLDGLVYWIVCLKGVYRRVVEWSRGVVDGEKFRLMMRRRGL